MARLFPRPVGYVLTLYDVWRRLPPKQRKLALEIARKHGPRAVSKAVQMQRSRRKPSGRPPTCVALEDAERAPREARRRGGGCAPARAGAPWDAPRWASPATDGRHTTERHRWALPPRAGA